MEIGIPETNFLPVFELERNLTIHSAGSLALEPFEEPQHIPCIDPIHEERHAGVELLRIEEERVNLQLTSAAARTCFGHEIRRLRRTDAGEGVGQQTSTKRDRVRPREHRLDVNMIGDSRCTKAHAQIRNRNRSPLQCTCDVKLLNPPGGHPLGDGATVRARPFRLQAKGAAEDKVGYRRHRPTRQDGGEHRISFCETRFGDINIRAPFA